MVLKIERSCCVPDIVKQIIAVELIASPSLRRSRLCRNSTNRLRSACHAGLDPASSIGIPLKTVGFRVKPGMTNGQHNQRFVFLLHDHPMGDYQ
jgi:hypothetical protein